MSDEGIPCKVAAVGSAMMDRTGRRMHRIASGHGGGAMRTAWRTGSTIEFESRSKTSSLNMVSACVHAVESRPLIFACSGVAVRYSRAARETVGLFVCVRSSVR